MNLKVEPSGLNKRQKPKKQRLQELFKRVIAPMLLLVPGQIKKLKKKNQYQTILFPQQHKIEQYENISKELKEQYCNEQYYPFYLSRCHIFIDNDLLKIGRIESNIAIKFSQIDYGRPNRFVQSIGTQQKNIFLVTTTLNFIVFLDKNNNFLAKYSHYNKFKLANNQIICCNSHGNYLFVFFQNQIHVLKYLIQSNNQFSISAVLKKDIQNQGMIQARGFFINNKIYLFNMNSHTLSVRIIELGFFTNDIEKQLFCSKNLLVSLKIYIQTKTNRFLIAIASVQAILLMQFFFADNSSKYLNVVRNNKNRISLFRRNRPYINFISRQNYSLCAVAFNRNLCFIKVDSTYTTISFRVNLDYPIQYVNSIGKHQGLILVVRTSLSHRHKKVYLTHQNKLISYEYNTNFNLVAKYQEKIYLKSVYKFYEFDDNRIMKIGNNCVFISGNTFQIYRLSYWQEIYNDLAVTQNLKLLKFLILLKNQQSPFLYPPSSFQGLELFFPKNTIQTRQILLQYYCLMNLSPQFSLKGEEYLMIPFIIEHIIHNLDPQVMQNLSNWCIDFDQRLVQQMIVAGSEFGWQLAFQKCWIRAFKAMVQQGMQIQMPILKLYSLAILQKSSKKDQKEVVVQKMSQKGKEYLDHMVTYIIFSLTMLYKDLNNNQIKQQFLHFLMIIVSQQFWNLMIKFIPRQSIKIVSALFNSSARISIINKYASPKFSAFKALFSQLTFSQGYSNSQQILSHLSQTYLACNPQDQYRQLLMIQHGRLQILKQNDLNSQRQFIQPPFRKSLVNFSNQKNQQNLQKNVKNVNSFNLFRILMSLYDNFYQIQAQAIAIPYQIRKQRQRMNSTQHFSFKIQYLVNILLLFNKNKVQVLKAVALSKYSNLQENQSQIQNLMFKELLLIWKQLFLNIIYSSFQKKNRNIRQKQSNKSITYKQIVREELLKILDFIQDYDSANQIISIHVMIALNEQNEYTSRIFQKFMKCTNNVFRENIFVWIKKTIKTSIQLQNQFIANLKQIMQINIEQTKQILKKFYNGKQKQIIKKIDNDPNLQLQYVQLIINNTVQRVDSYYIRLHVQLLLQLKPSTLIDILQEAQSNSLVSYNVPDVLKMTLQRPKFSQKSKILIYLYQKEGQILECINLYLEIFQNIFESYIVIFQNRNNDDLMFADLLQTTNPNIHKQNKQMQLLQFFSDMLKLIFQQNMRRQQYFNRVIQKFKNIIIFIKRQNFQFKQEYFRLIYGYFGKFIAALVEKGCLKQLRKVLQISLAFEFSSQVRVPFETCYIQASSERAIYSNAQVLMKTQLLQGIKSSLHKIQESISSQAKCHVCDQDFSDQYLNHQALLFSCGHLYHKQCIDPINGVDYCYYCMAKNQFMAMIEKQQLDLMALLKNYRQKLAMIINDLGLSIKVGRKKQSQQSLAQKRLNRLEFYDKRVTSIQTQSQILDVKLLIDEHYSSLKKKKR